MGSLSPQEKQRFRVKLQPKFAVANCCRHLAKKNEKWFRFFSNYFAVAHCGLCLSCLCVCRFLSKGCKTDKTFKNFKSSTFTFIGFLFAVKISTHFGDRVPYIARADVRTGSANIGLPLNAAFVCSKSLQYALCELFQNPLFLLHVVIWFSMWQLRCYRTWPECVYFVIQLPAALQSLLVDEAIDVLQEIGLFYFTDYLFLHSVQWVLIKSCCSFVAGSIRKKHRLPNTAWLNKVLA